VTRNTTNTGKSIDQEASGEEKYIYLHIDTALLLDRISKAFAKRFSIIVDFIMAASGKAIKTGILDFINQTSDKPPYFLKQRSSKWFITLTVAMSVFTVGSDLTRG
jgi:hypothetical protein